MARRALKRLALGGFIILALFMALTPLANVIVFKLPAKQLMPVSVNGTITYVEAYTETIVPFSYILIVILIILAIVVIAWVAL